MRRTKYGHLTLIGVSSDKVIPDTDFADKKLVKRNIPVVKMLL